MSEKDIAKYLDKEMQRLKTAEHYRHQKEQIRIEHIEIVAFTLMQKTALDIDEFDAIDIAKVVIEALEDYGVLFGVRMSE